MKSEKEKTFPS